MTALAPWNEPSDAARVIQSPTNPAAALTPAGCGYERELHSTTAAPIVLEHPADPTIHGVIGDQERNHVEERDEMQARAREVVRVRGDGPA